MQRPIRIEILGQYNILTEHQANLWSLLLSAYLQASRQERDQLVSPADLIRSLT